MLFGRSIKNKKDNVIAHPSAPLIQAVDLHFGYGEEPVLSNINMEIFRGEFVGVIGPNGSGKSSLIKLLTGLAKPSSGKVLLWGEPLETFNRWSAIGYVPQKAASFNAGFPATIWEAVATGRLAGKGLFDRLNSHDKEIVQWALEQVSLASLADRLVGNLSGGQQQRVFIAQALASQPEILFLDEPATGVDSEQQEAFYTLLQRLNKENGLTIVMVSHDLGVVTQLVSKLLCLNRRLYFHGEVGEFLNVQEEILSKAYGPAMRVVHHCH